jgi:hypothetical protein
MVPFKIFESIWKNHQSKLKSLHESFVRWFFQIDTLTLKANLNYSVSTYLFTNFFKSYTNPIVILKVIYCDKTKIFLDTLEHLAGTLRHPGRGYSSLA